MTVRVLSSGVRNFVSSNTSCWFEVSSLGFSAELGLQS